MLLWKGGGQHLVLTDETLELMDRAEQTVYAAPVLAELQSWRDFGPRYYGILDDVIDLILDNLIE